MDGNGAKAVILMGHGSRVPSAGESMEKVAQKLKCEGEFGMVEICYMSRLGPRFPETLQKCVNGGAKEVILIPYFLNLGLHMLIDIPEMMEREARKYPGVKIVFGKNIGYDELLVDLLKKRIDESKDLCDVRMLEIEPKENFELPPGEKEFVAMSPEDARKFRQKHGHGDMHEH